MPPRGAEARVKHGWTDTEEAKAVQDWHVIVAIKMGWMAWAVTTALAGAKTGNWLGDWMRGGVSRDCANGASVDCEDGIGNECRAWAWLCLLLGEGAAMHCRRVAGE